MKSWKFKGNDLRKLPKVEVIWHDAATCGGWRSLKRYQDEESLIECRAVGYMTKKNKKEVQVVQQISKPGSASDAVTIPIHSVKKIKRLR